MANIPSILKHCVLAIYRGKGLRAASSQARFKEAFQIAHSQLARYGYIKGGGEDFELTDKGRLQTMKRHAEGGRGEVKDREFDRMWVNVMTPKAPPARQPPEPREEEAAKVDTIHIRGRDKKKKLPGGYGQDW
jgi:hypothetical protein